MKKQIIVAPSLLSADKNHIVDEIAKAGEAGAKFLHIDIMDGVFVPNTSFTFDFVANVLTIPSPMVYDVHIMVSNPRVLGPKYAKAGADVVTFHYEACFSDLERRSVIAAIRRAGAKVGMSIKPATPVALLLPFVEDLDLVLVMSVEPGKGGQPFLDEALGKIASLRDFIDHSSPNGPKCLIEVDGGINEETGRLAAKAGADVLVAGSYLFGHDDFAQRVKGLLSI